MIRSHPDVVGDEQDRGAVFGNQPVEYRKHVTLDGHVESGGRLVGNQQLGVEPECHRDEHSLTHPARELARILFESLLGAVDFDPVQQIETAAPDLAPAELVPFQREDLGELRSDGAHRVQ